MTTKLNVDEQKALHGADYVERFEKGSSPDRIARLMELVPLSRKAVVADFGCGDGRVMDYVHSKVAHYVGVDFSPQFIESANRRRQRISAENCELVCASIPEFCKAHPDQFDLVLLLDISEHVYDDEWSKIVTSVFQTLKPGGLVYLHTPNANFFAEMLKHHGFILRQFPEHIAVRNERENKQFFEAAGFKEIRTKHLSHYNLLKYIHFLSQTPVVGRFFRARIFLEAQKPVSPG